MRGTDVVQFMQFKSDKAVSLERFSTQKFDGGRRLITPAQKHYKFKIQITNTLYELIFVY